MTPDLTGLDADAVHALFAALADPVVVADRSGAIQFANAAAERMFAYPAGLLRGRSIDTLLPDAQRTRHAWLREQYSHAERPRVMGQGRSFRGLRFDGSEVHLDIALTPMLLEGIPVVVAILRDVSVAAQRAEEAEEAMARLRLLHRVGQMTLEQLDFATSTQAIAEDLLAVLAADFASIGLLDARQQAVTIQARAQRPGSQAKSMTPVPMSASLAEQGLLAVLDGRDVYIGSPESATPLARKRMAALGVGSLCVTPWQAGGRVAGLVFVGHHDREACNAAQRQFLATLAQQLSVTQNHMKLVQDLRRSNADLVASQAVVLQRERLRAMVEISAGVVHDINNAVSPVVAVSDMLLESRKDLDDTLREDLDVIRMAGRDIAEIAKRMRASYRPQPERESPLPLNPAKLVENALQLTRVRWRDMAQLRGSQIHVALQVEPNLPTFPGFESDVREALVNVIINAVDAMGTGGTLGVTVERGAEEGNGQSQAPVVFRVSDTGHGMDALTRDRCREAFFTTKGEQGTGLGLSLVAGTVRRHGGVFQIESEPKRGTSVSLSFPLGALPKRRGPLPSVLLTLPFERPLRVLHVDDEPLLRHSVSGILSALGHLPVPATSGAEGVALFSEALGCQQPFDVVVTDLGMSGLNGRAVAKRLRELAPQTPLVLLSGWAGEAEEEATVRTDFDAVVCKPPTMDSLRRALAEAMACGSR